MVEEVVKVVPNGGTRLKLVIVVGVISTVAWLVSFFGYASEGQEVSYQNWSSTMTWLLGIYGTTEMGAKSATAYMNKGKQ